MRTIYRVPRFSIEFIITTDVDKSELLTEELIESIQKSDRDDGEKNLIFVFFLVRPE